MLLNLSTKTKRYSLLIVLLILFSATAIAQNADKPKITVFGSSVAYGASAKDSKGYWYMLKDLMESRGWEVSNCSRGGDRTSRILDRFDDLLSHEPDYVFIGLSLANEGIREKKDDKERDAVYIQYKWGMKGIIALLRSQGIEPVIGLCYPHGHFTPIEIEYVKRMNLLINTWDVPSANFLGALDDGSGRWVKDYEGDPWHPNTEGHQEMFYAIVPTLFDAMEAGKPIPTKASGEEFATLGNIEGKLLTVYFDSADTIHSWATSFWFRTKQENDYLAKIGPGSLQIVQGRLRYTSDHDDLIQSKVNVSDGQGHHVVVSHRYAQGETLLFVDGRLCGTVAEKVEPKKFAIGASEGGHDFKEWMVYRAALNEMEVQALYDGKLLQASLEIYAPLTDEKFQVNKPVQNRAQSLSEAIFTDMFTPNL